MDEHELIEQKSNEKEATKPDDTVFPSAITDTSYI